MNFHIQVLLDIEIGIFARYQTGLTLYMIKMCKKFHHKVYHTPWATQVINRKVNVPMKQIINF